ncbi:ISL3 family transposase [Dulcicalothrix desertica]|uniref:ISL3 family transposase n=2 Tax=Dulcicalothrix desertica TaxID=32056 RepID=UPI00119A45DC|nr:ISL3 family transposase [Dulcicalothrix desertica]TWH39528.1 transposase [Dulcicalothrix desertica PCC 7102]
MKRVLTELLNLPDVVVESSLQEGSVLILSVSKKVKSAVCPHCGKKSEHLHQNQKYLVKDLPMGDKEVILNLNRRRFKCKTCRKTFSEHLDFVGTKKGFTHRYAENIVKQVISSDVSNVAKNNGLSDEEVNSMIEEVAQKLLPIDLSNLRRLGIDEISLVKGQGKFIVVLVDIDTGKLIGLVKERKQIVIENFMKTWGEEVLDKIEEVSIDMTGNYKSLVDKVCSNAVVTVDRFHVTKVIHQELNQARIDEKKTALELNVESREKVFDSLKGNKFTLLKAESELTDKQKDKLDKIREASPLLGTMHSLKEEFRNIFDNSEDLGEGILGLLDWLKKAEPYYQKSVKTITRWFGEIIGYFERRTTNGVVEGINNKLKLIKRSGFGFRNFRNFEIRALLSWHYDINLAR